MMEAYRSGDPYLEFAKQAGAVPSDATKKSHGAAREKFKGCALAVQYGMGPTSLAARLGEPPVVGRDLLEMHRRTYPQYWEWSQAAIDQGMLGGRLWTTFGWQLHAGQSPRPTSLGNFPMQANGAEMMRIACCLATEAGIHLCAPVHDALLIEAPEGEVEQEVARTQAFMKEASGIVLGDFKLRSDAKVITWPDRYSDPRGQRMWEEVSDLIETARAKAMPVHGCNRDVAPAPPPYSLLSIYRGGYKPWCLTSPP
jgi:DNA polymerase I